MNRLYFRDNLKWLSDRKEFPDASVDLVYLDPPFNSNADYNVLFRELSGQVSQGPIPRVHRHVELGRCRRDR
jgi:site-specific DNA-methyltransferase (adenine-specific)